MKECTLYPPTRYHLSAAIAEPTSDARRRHEELGMDESVFPFWLMNGGWRYFPLIYHLEAFSPLPGGNLSFFVERVFSWLWGCGVFQCQVTRTWTGVTMHPELLCSGWKYISIGTLEYLKKFALTRHSMTCHILFRAFLATLKCSTGGISRCIFRNTV